MRHANDDHNILCSAVLCKLFLYSNPDISVPPFSGVISFRAFFQIIPSFHRSLFLSGVLPNEEGSRSLDHCAREKTIHGRNVTFKVQTLLFGLDFQIKSKNGIAWIQIEGCEKKDYSGMPNQLPNHVRMNQCFFSPLRSPIIPWSVKTKEKLLIEPVPNSLGRPKQKIEGEEDPSYWCSLPRSLRHEGISFLSSIHVLCRKEKSL